jgi:hypothetical protein
VKRQAVEPNLVFACYLPFDVDRGLLISRRDSRYSVHHLLLVKWNSSAIRARKGGRVGR